MSRIERVDPVLVEKPGAGPGGRDEVLFLVRIVTEDGLVGWGEAHGAPKMLEAVVTAPVTHASAAGLAALLVGRDARDVPALWRHLYAGTKWVGRDGVVMQAIAACDIALWDLAGKRVNAPVSDLLARERGLDRPLRRDLRVYASGKVGPTPDATAARVAAEVAAGHDMVKIGWPPFGAALDTDLAHLAAARDAIGPKVALAVDGAQAWDVATARERIAAFAPFDLAFLEEPIDRDDHAGNLRLRGRGVPIAGGEGESSAPALIRMIETGALDIVQIDVTRMGLTPALRVLDAAEARGLEVMSHSFTSALNVAAHLHLLAVARTATRAEWPTAPMALWGDVFEVPPTLVGGTARVPEGAGMGPDPRHPFA